MTVPFLDARFDECRTPRWTDDTPVLQRMVCGAPTLPARSYCAACRDVLIAGVIDKDGRPRWFKASVGARWRKLETASTTIKIGDADEESIADDADSLFDAPDPDRAENPTAVDAEPEPEGARPLQPSDLFDWGMAA